jgi:hypothetical protein
MHTDEIVHYAIRIRKGEERTFFTKRNQLAAYLLAFAVSGEGGDRERADVV